MKIFKKLHFNPFLFCAIFAVALMMAGCGGGGGGNESAAAPSGEDATPPATGNPAPTTLYPPSSGSCLSSEQATDCISDTFRLGSTTEYSATLSGDITGTNVGIHIWVYAVGTQFNAAFILRKGDQETQLASWSGLTTTNASDYELIEKSAVIEEQETASGDRIIFRMTSANSEEWVSFRYGCLDSHITIPNTNSNDISCSAVELPPEEPPVDVDCSAFSITPSDTTATFGEVIIFEAENGTPPYTWSIDTPIDSTIDDNGNYTAGNEPEVDLIQVTDSNECSAEAFVEVTE